MCTLVKIPHCLKSCVTVHIISEGSDLRFLGIYIKKRLLRANIFLLFILKCISQQNFMKIDHVVQELCAF